MNPDQIFVLILVGVGIGCIMPIALAFIIPAAKARARKIEAGGRPDDQLLAHVDALTSRVNELEERVDFAERMLAQKREPEPLPGREAAR
jgi:hypothetical protein